MPILSKFSNLEAVPMARNMSYRLASARLKFPPGPSSSFTSKLKLRPSLKAPLVSTRPLRRFTQDNSSLSPTTRSWFVTPFLTLLFLSGLGAAAYGVYVMNHFLQIPLR